MFLLNHVLLEHSLPGIGLLDTYKFTALAEHHAHPSTSAMPSLELEEQTIRDNQKILMPINWGNNHWAMAAIDRTTRTIYYFDSMHNISKLRTEDRREKACTVIKFVFTTIFFIFKLNKNFDVECLSIVRLVKSWTGR